ncbi:transmembrane protein 244-like isoform X1 [Rhincodon typus]|uniref:transmembrane protein 244-like isoform X1 n=1 Tax=Rhincodon typus TaxID=259920 RepID=UPI00202FC942|nr:transmembrane protein 244-like isoform X1 [Rhincodon typus]
MAFKGKTAGTKTVLLNLLQCSLVFYTLYYMIGSVCFGAFRLDSFDGLLPFDFKTQAEKSVSKYLVNLLSMELTYFTSGILFAIIVKKRVWDYSITVTLVHVILSSAVMAEFPLAWQWWLALDIRELKTGKTGCLFTVEFESHLDVLMFNKRHLEFPLHFSFKCESARLKYK